MYIERIYLSPDCGLYLLYSCKLQTSQGECKQKKPEKRHRLLLGLGPHFVLEVVQLGLSSLEIQHLTLLPHVFVVEAVHRAVGTLSDETRLEKHKVGGASVPPFQGHLVFLHIILGDWVLVSGNTLQASK